MTRLEQDEAYDLAHSDTNPFKEAILALKFGELDHALRCWRIARERYSHYTIKAPETLEILTGLNLLDEAEVLMYNATNKYPGIMRFAEGYALVAERRGDLLEADKRWKSVRKRFPNSWIAYANAAQTLRRLGRLDEAEALSKKATTLFPDSIHGWLEFANLAEIQEKWEEASERWRQVTERFRHDLGILGQARAMIQLKDYESADKLLEKARPCFPTNADIARTWVLIAELRGDTEATKARNNFITQRFPERI